ncbi:MAG: hypothetical protein KQH63_04525 [Desulfobulbaceae bacterium]|nr:hypothetical protein [Desulfobulbaceae bacterium]
MPDKKYIINDKPQVAPPPTRDEIKKIFDKLAPHIGKNKKIALAGETRRGTRPESKEPKGRKMEPED